MGAAIQLRAKHAIESCEASCVARVEIVRDMQSAEAIWRDIETDEFLLTPFQRFDLLNAWQRNVGELEGFTPLIVLARDHNDRPLLLLPLGIQRENGAKTAYFLGGKHITFNMGIWRRDFAASATKNDIDFITRKICRCDDAIDVLAFLRQPRSWRGLPNPLAMLTGQPSTNACPVMTIAPDTKPEDMVSNSFRRRLKGKERKLQLLPGYRYLLAESDAEVRRLLDAFFINKPLRMALQKLPNVFATPGIRDFVYDMCLARLPGGQRAIEIHALVCDEEMIAMFAGVADGERFSMMFNTYTVSENSRYSPGLILLREIIDRYARLNYRSLDLGTGSDSYKLLFCKKDEPTFDSFIPLTSLGRLSAFGMSSLTHAKRLVKQQPVLTQMAQLARRMLSR